MNLEYCRKFGIPDRIRHVISLGAGVQSSTIALMATHGEITPMPEFCLFADTQDEGLDTYKWLEYLKPLLSFPVYTCTRNRLSEHLVEGGHSHLPIFRRTTTGKKELGKRQCTTKWKLAPIYREIRELTGLKHRRLPDGYFHLWQGITTDEASRMKPCKFTWITNTYPLIDLGMSRGDCLRWLSKNGYETPPKSSCVYCPYQSLSQWKAREQKGGEDWQLVLKVEKELMERGEYLNQHLLPISTYVKLKAVKKEPNHFINECSGICGV